MGLTLPVQGEKKKRKNRLFHHFRVTSLASKTYQSLEAVGTSEEVRGWSLLPSITVSFFISFSSLPLLCSVPFIAGLPWNWPSGFFSLPCREPHVIILAHRPNPPALNSLTHNTLGSPCFLVNVLKRIIVVSQLQARCEVTV